MPAERDDRDRNAEGRAENQRPRDRTGRPLPYDTDETALAEDFTYDTVDEALATGVTLWDAERYFEAHECLEDVWHHAAPADREFWKGVIQVAVGCVHHQRGNSSGAVTLWRRGADRLAAYPDVHHGVDVEQLAVFARGAAAAVEEAGFCVEVGYPELPRMDDGPWVGEPDGRETPLSREPAWRAGAAQLRAGR
jgi:predicted metal-dependent hydrolase